MRDSENCSKADSFSISNACSPLQMTEGVIELLKQENVPTADVQELLGQLAGSLNQRFASCCNQAVFDDAVLRAPWLTAEAERVKQQQSDMLLTLNSCCLLSRNLGQSLDVARQLLGQLSDFLELYVETETAQEELFHNAFPSPDWTMLD